MVGNVFNFDWRHKMTTSAEKQTSLNTQSPQRVGGTDFIIVDNSDEHWKASRTVILLLKCRSVAK